MACPYFHPTQRFEDGAWLTPPRLPLGDPCRGLCVADPNTPVEPDSDELRRFCNLGYARGACVRFPRSTGAADAVRFSIAGDRNSVIDIVYILEKDYGPVRHATLVWNLAESGFSTALESPAVEAQARRFVESYLKRRVQA